MIRKYIIVADDSIKGFDEEIAKLEREWGAEEIEPCEDCVSRESLLILLDADTQDTNPYHFNLEDKESYGEWMLNNGFNTALVQARIYTNKLPSVKPQRPKGKWIITGCYYKCKNCEAEINGEINYMSKSKIKYCPYCGIKLEGE